jgi:molybdenum cofactor biosynthesis enzyme MoaA
MKLAVNNPNLSVIMPVGCNAACGFCYWKKQTGLTKERFQFICDTLPKIFEQCSITGGEPTIHDELSDFLIIAKKRFKKVVLNTNGFKLKKEHIEIADYVNISRHHFDDFNNNIIFNSSTIPPTKKLKELCNYGNVTLNCFLPDGFRDKIFIKKYIDYAKKLNAKVTFRKYYNNLDILKYVDIDDTLIGQHSCGACLHRWHKINDIDVTFKYSVNETSDHMNGDIYELILQANGNLTYDWAGKNILKYKEV